MKILGTPMDGLPPLAKIRGAAPGVYNIKVLLYRHYENFHYVTLFRLPHFTLACEQFHAYFLLERRRLFTTPT